MIAGLQNIFDQLRSRWDAWLGECFPSAVPLPVIPEIPGRDALLVQLEERRKTQAQDSATRHEAVQALTRELSEAQQRVDQLQQRLTAQHRVDWLANLQAGTETERLTAMILEKAPISLGLFVEELDHELSLLRQMDPVIIPSGSDRNYVLMKKTMRFQTNAGSIQRRVKALQAARARAVAMQTESMTVNEIIGEVYRLRQSLPAIVDEETRGPVAAAILS